jgi:hypothetical protein
MYVDIIIYVVNFRFPYIPKVKMDFHKVTESSIKYLLCTLCLLPTGT